MRTYNYVCMDDALPGLMEAVMSDGAEVPSRNGMTRELLNIGITLQQPWRREILHPHRKANLAAQIAETMWVLAGRNDIGWLGHYLPRAADFSDDGKVWRGGYGPRIRDWGGVDQLMHCIAMLQQDQSTRRAIISIYDPAVDTNPGKDIPCNNWIAFNARNGKLHTHVAIRSNDLMWGWTGINAFEWSVVHEIVAAASGLEMGPLHFSVASEHLYEQHWEKAQALTQPLYHHELSLAPRYRWTGDFDAHVQEWFTYEEQIRKGHPVDVDGFPAPMFRSWLRILQWWWTGHKPYLAPLQGTRLHRAAEVALQPKFQEEPHIPPTPSIVEEIDALHREKHAAYGDSWKRRGEMLGIMANIARKVDRLGANTSDETSRDTALDLLVYLCKYRWWLVDTQGAPIPVAVDAKWKVPYSDHTEPVKKLLEQLSRTRELVSDIKGLESALTLNFENLEKHINQGLRESVVDTVDNMSMLALDLVRKLW